MKKTVEGWDTDNSLKQILRIFLKTLEHPQIIQYFWKILTGFQDFPQIPRFSKTVVNNTTDSTLSEGDASTYTGSDMYAGWFGEL